MACPPPGSTTANPNAIDKYSQGYSYADPAILAKVDATMADHLRRRRADCR